MGGAGVERGGCRCEELLPRQPNQVPGPLKGAVRGVSVGGARRPGGGSWLSETVGRAHVRCAAACLAAVGWRR